MSREPDKRFGVFHILGLSVFPILLVFTALIINKTDWLSDVICYMQCGHIPDYLFKSGRSVKEQRILEYESGEKLVAARFSDSSPLEHLQNSAAVLAAVNASNEPLLSIIVDDDDLYDPVTGILANPFGRGRNWERLAHISYFEQGHALFAGGCGVRVHGGRSREMRPPSFRLHFRGVYGTPHLPEKLLFGGRGDPIKSLVVHNDLRWNTRGDGSKYKAHFGNPLAFDIANRIGSITPATKPVRIYLNGNYLGVYVLMEHLSIDFLRARFGDGDFTFGRGKSNSKRAKSVEMGDPEALRTLYNELSNGDVPLTMSYAEKRFDLANMTNWFIGILITGVTDAFQGITIKSPDISSGRWFWINWDMDHAFQDIYSIAPPGRPWEIDLFDSDRQSIENYRQSILHPRHIRAVLFDRLSRESPEYRSYFLRRFIDVLNHEATTSFIRERVRHYQDKSVSFGVTDTSYLASVHEYANKRPEIIRQQVSKHFDAGPAYRLEVVVDESLDLTVDGYRSGNTYVGWYYNETPANIRISSHDSAADFVWIIDGKSLPESLDEMDVRMTSDLSVQINAADPKQLSQRRL
jgi:hypothetical protein